MGVLKTSFYAWKRIAHPEIRLTQLQVEYIDIFFKNVESAEDEPLPNVEGQSILQSLISEFWNNAGQRLLL